MNSQALLQRLQTIVADNEGCLVAARNERCVKIFLQGHNLWIPVDLLWIQVVYNKFFFCRMERSLNQTLRAQQDQAYEDSLQADREKERLKRLDQQRREEEERQRRESERQEQLERDVSTCIFEVLEVFNISCW